MNKITHKFYIVGLILLFFFGLGYAQLAFFLQNEAESTLKVQEAQVVKNDIQRLKLLFIEIRFWEKIIFTEGTPEAERKFGLLLQMIHRQLSTLQTNATASGILDNLDFISQKLTGYEAAFGQIVQLETEQRLGQTLLENTYQSLTANILSGKETRLLRPVFNLSHFQQHYLDNHRSSEYQALKIVLQALEKKLQQRQSTDKRLKEYCLRYRELLDHDFRMEKKIQQLNESFDELSGQVSEHVQTAIEITNGIVEQETKICTQLRRNLYLSFFFSMTLTILGIFLISAYILRQIINPIRALSEVSRNIQEGRMSARFIPLPKAPAELTELGISFNVMLDTLASREKELADHRDSLEDLVVSRTRKLNEANRSLSQEIASRIEVEQEIQQYADTQTVLLQEVNHRVKNNLVAIISMLHQEEDRARAEGGPESGVRLQEVVGRISGLLTVHRLLSSSQWEPLSLSELSQNIIQGVFKGVPVGKSITLDVGSSDVRINSDQAHYLAIVLNELATNTMKYALYERDAVQTRVCTHLQDDSICLVYYDDGPGYPEFVLNGEIPKTCIGFQLILGIVSKSLQGKIELLNDNGAMARIIFPAMTSESEMR